MRRFVRILALAMLAVVVGFYPLLAPTPHRIDQTHFELIGERDFVDRVRRAVHQDADGRQYVYDDGQRVYGLWILTPEAEAAAPCIMGAKSVHFPVPRGK